jgi:hypothetical protein
LLDRRLGSYDGAAYLWENLCEIYSQSKLRPFALYRLGWTYRSTSAQGLPGDSEKSFAKLLKDYPDSDWAGLAKEAQAVAWKSKDTATLLSLVPGAGQVYSGEPSNGLLRFAVALAGLAAFVAPSVAAYDRREDLNWNRDWPLALLGTGGLVVLSVDYTMAYQDAIRAVVQFNEKQEQIFLEGHPKAP